MEQVSTSKKVVNKKVKIFLIVFFLFIVTILVFIYNSNNEIQLTYYKFKNYNAQNKVKIVHISDLHQKYFGKNNKNLIKKIKNEKPDLIFITGDIASFSSDKMKILNDKSLSIYNANLDYIMKTLKRIQPLAPTYFVLGNHEHVFEKFDDGFSRFKQIVNNANVELLINEEKTVKVGDTNINILGVDNTDYKDVTINNMVKNFENKNGLKIILDHYPTDFALNGYFSYKNYDIDYVFSGHEHGGQIRIPFIGGIFSHEEGLLPKYAEGVHVVKNSTLIISRGLGNSIIPIRLFNRPQLVVVEIN